MGPFPHRQANGTGQIRMVVIFGRQGMAAVEYRRQVVAVGRHRHGKGHAVFLFGHRHTGKFRIPVVIFQNGKRSGVHHPGGIGADGPLYPHIQQMDIPGDPGQFGCDLLVLPGVGTGIRFPEITAGEVQAAVLQVQDALEPVNWLVSTWVPVHTSGFSRSAT